MELATVATASLATPCTDCCTDCPGYNASACCTTACCGPCCDVDCGLMNAAGLMETSSYQYVEPEENFVSIDDVKIKGLLLKIGQEQQAAEQQRRELAQQQQIIELLDDEEEEKATQPPTLIISTTRSSHAGTKKAKRQSPDIQLIPKHRIVAQIELLDSDSEQEQLQPNSEPDDDEELPFAAAAAVSCELQEQEHNTEQIITLQSDDELDALVPMSMRSARSYVKRRGRHIYECLACGKQVQSNYNLRRHMMIHTGERPFPCDLCERRFREFSDLKKHRRRHASEAHYICMICRQQPPTEQDSTRCAHCEGKNLLLKPQGSDDQGQDNAYVSNEEADDDDAAAAAAAAVPMPTPTPVQAQSALRLTVVAAAKTPTPTPTLPPSPPVQLTAAICNSSSSSIEEPLAVRGPTRRKAFPCPLCHRPFGTRHNLKRHFMIHTGEKPYSCNKCRKPFREWSTLKKHMVTHARERWYKCPHCPQKFQDYLRYASHKGTHASEPHELGAGKSQSLLHYESGDDDSFEDGDDSVDDWLECCECNRRFTELNAYTAHLQQHHAELYGMSVPEEEQQQQQQQSMHVA